MPNKRAATVIHMFIKPIRLIIISINVATYTYKDRRNTDRRSERPQLFMAVTCQNYYHEYLPT